VFNQNEELTDEDRNLIEATNDHNRIIILNKMDLENKLNIDELQTLVEPKSIISTSIISQEGLKDLEQKIADLFFSGQTGDRDATYVSNIRHIALLNDAVNALDEVIGGIEMDMPVDLVQIDMTRAWDLLGEITGDSVQDELITQLFSQFCLGK